MSKARLVAAAREGAKCKLLALSLAIALAGTASPAGAVVARPTPSGMALAAEALLRRADFGPGWSASPPSKAVPALTCQRFHPPTPGVTEAGAVVSSTFSGDSSGPFVSQDAYAYPTGAQRAAFWRQVARPGLIRCLKAGLARTSAQGVHFTVVGARALPLPGLGVSARGYRVHGTADTTNQSVDVYVDLILMGSGRTITAVNVASFEQPVRRRFELRLARIVASRMSAR